LLASYTIATVRIASYRVNGEKSEIEWGETSVSTDQFFELKQKMVLLNYSIRRYFKRQTKGEKGIRTIRVVRGVAI